MKGLQAVESFSQHILDPSEICGVAGCKLISNTPDIDLSVMTVLKMAG